MKPGAALALPDQQLISFFFFLWRKDELVLTTVLTTTQANTSEQWRRVIACIWLIYQVLWPVTNSGERTNTDF